jgi:hypothetical protein
MPGSLKTRMPGMLVCDFMARTTPLILVVSSIRYSRGTAARLTASHFQLSRKLGALDGRKRRSGALRSDLYPLAQNRHDFFGRGRWRLRHRRVYDLRFRAGPLELHGGSEPRFVVCPALLHQFHGGLARRFFGRPLRFHRSPTALLRLALPLPGLPPRDAGSNHGDGFLDRQQDPPLGRNRHLPGVVSGLLRLGMVADNFTLQRLQPQKELRRRVVRRLVRDRHGQRLLFVGEGAGLKILDGRCLCRHHFLLQGFALNTASALVNT